MELYQLKSFITIAETGNLTQAADRLFISQPALSAHIKALEEEFDIKLFNRISTGMELTDNGEALKDKALQILESSDEIRLQAKMLQNKVSTQLRIGLNADAVFLKLGKLIDELRTHHPSVKANIIAGNTPVLMEQLSNGSIDGTFFFGQNNDQKLESIHLTDTTIHIAGSIKWQDQILNEDIESLAKLPWIYPAPNCPYLDVLDMLFEGVDSKPEFNTEATSEVYVNELIKSGAGLALIMEEEAQPMLEQGQICLWPGASFKLPVGFAYQTKRKEDPDIVVLSDILKRLFR